MDEQEQLKLETLEQRNLLTTYADDMFTITNNQGDGGLDAGDEVTFAEGETGEVTGLIFGTDAFSTIQEAVDAADPEETVMVGTGTFVENVTINKNITLLSTQGREMTTIEGITGDPEFGAIFVTNNTTGVQIGGVDQGFTIIGIDNANPGLEKAAIYFQGSHSDAEIYDNEIQANGDSGMTTEYAATITGFIIDGNEFSGKTFVGEEPAGTGFSQQFSLFNVPRQLLVMGGGTGGGNTSNITFTNNELTGIVGGSNIDGEQGNTMITLDSVGATITGNTFAGTTTRFGSALRARGPNTEISGNSFDNTNMSETTNFVFLGAPTLLTVTTLDVFLDNTFTNRVLFNVSGDTVFHFDDLQTLIDNASPGDTIGAGGDFTGDADVNQADMTLLGNFDLEGTLTMSGMGSILAATATLDGLVLGADSITRMEISDPFAPNDIQQIIVDGTISIDPAAELELIFDAVPPIGPSFILFVNDSDDAITGAFADLAQGVTFTVTTTGLDDFELEIDYTGNNGNDLVVHTAQAFFVVGADAGGGPHVRILDKDGNETFSFFAYNPAFVGGVRVATGDVNGDGVLDIITAPGASGGPHVKVFDGTDFSVISEFFAYDPAFVGGVFIASGDVNGDGFDDIITSPGASGGPHVKVFSGEDLSVITEFFAYNPAFTGGVFVAAGDVDGDDMAEIVTAPGAGGGPHIRIFDENGTQAPGNEFYAYASNVLTGVHIAVGDVNGDGFDDIITGPGAGGGPHVRAFDATDFSLLQDFFAYNPAFTGGVRVGSADINRDGFADIITTTGPGGGPHTQAFSGVDLEILSNYFAYNPAFSGGVFVGGGLTALDAPEEMSAPFTEETSEDPVGDSYLYQEELKAKKSWIEELDEMYSEAEKVDDLFSGLGIK
ncbi:Hypothetical protein PBC10988_29840 [Planctomycetales bacterium 10988]|nr:Hypothetical protein PBC10988_29840 [Planctomycetales bacterium 10988]